MADSGGPMDLPLVTHCWTQVDCYLGSCLLLLAELEYNIHVKYVETLCVIHLDFTCNIADSLKLLVNEM